MSDILIRGMEMPTMEQAYKTLIISYDGKVYEGVHPQPTAKKKEPIAEAVELPPHGDLIQRSDVLAVVDEAYEYGDVIKRKDFDEPNIPTIVPAERSEP